MKTYKTSQIAQIIGIHVNTVRLYEECKLISKPVRLPNGYRVFTELHIEQFKLARVALKTELLQNGLRNQVVEIIKTSALLNFDEAKFKADNYIQQVELELLHAEEAIEIAKQMLTDASEYNRLQEQAFEIAFTRKETADYLQVTLDTLRNWELNGLITVKRRNNGYRIYTDVDLKKLKMIRSLRCANYSLSAILRMLHLLSESPTVNIRKAINTPLVDDDVITACDKLLTSLAEAKSNMQYVIEQIEKISYMK